MSEIPIARKVAPRTREERKASKDKESIEKQRLQDRREKYYKYEDSGLTCVDPKSAMFQPDSQRFVSSAAEDERTRSIDKRRRDASRWEFKQDLSRQREETRRTQMEKEKDFEKKRMDMKKTTLGTKNQSGCCYDIITHKYTKGDAAIREQRKEDAAWQRATDRRQFLGKMNKSFTLQEQFGGK
ncbi:hypothetical protein ADUPG1_006147 [Aduncisulcus paluster]|uniref:Uncharacterized protein n=1 Tax=Aduncisulcus paluster TaxID=2918883 RepID=A0ABQ5KGZ6_9EUKA|nr:hypothetical protein ADUPG1_006147 [Aduncisulcus paluster]|eukprot:gnl/Carplike_NY0171/1617_a2185_795.p1 GENE.gnl/Carplike_NY0171/1617_a2185_795~~gnl/Carplike_NY0171/1617_a2185_795.p1  ORF type:complete len:184 (-),score=37.44 gnl/Carplike_NY0171/1617_a2185_795:186-737(-)